MPLKGIRMALCAVLLKRNLLKRCEIKKENGDPKKERGQNELYTNNANVYTKLQCILCAYIYIGTVTICIEQEIPNRITRSIDVRRWY